MILGGGKYGWMKKRFDCFYNCLPEMHSVAMLFHCVTFQCDARDESMV